MAKITKTVITAPAMELRLEYNEVSALISGLRAGGSLGTNLNTRADILKLLSTWYEENSPI